MTTTLQKEVRCINAEFRLATETDQPSRIVGYAAKYDSISELNFNKQHGAFREVIRPGAFDDSLSAGGEICCLFNHDMNLPLGKLSAGTLTVTSDEIGLAISVDIPDTQLGRDIRFLIGRRDLSKMSFGFYTDEDSWSEDADGNLVRELIKVTLFDVSIVTMPQYTDTECSLRSLDEFKAKQAQVTVPELPTVHKTITVAKKILLHA